MHGRRKFVEAQEDDPETVKQVLDSIGHLYQVETRIRDTELTGEQKRNFRLTHSKPMVDQLFAWFEQQRQRPELIPSNPLSKAIAYMQNREHELRVFLEDPAVPMDNNHTERALRVIPLGRNYPHPMIMQGLLGYLGEGLWRRSVWRHCCYRAWHKNSVSCGLVPSHRSIPCPPIKPSQTLFATTG